MITGRTIFYIVLAVFAIIRLAAQSQDKKRREAEAAARAHAAAASRAARQPSGGTAAKPAIAQARSDPYAGTKAVASPAYGAKAAAAPPPPSPSRPPARPPARPVAARAAVKSVLAAALSVKRDARAVDARPANLGVRTPAPRVVGARTTPSRARMLATVKQALVLGELLTPLDVRDRTRSW